ncbi:acylpyruvase FAHD1, mitochondrial-like [Mizuhopecten yessoensis]|uniref:acylpyruvase FAHD1, mitochondrial-like n=1 Tax=Mizuhopecten yessoensis TaxID=6573 RepID=UPI000B45C13A|nr:acylpyruvase FAHD1, mitochondrial-like [Mizuhopecten yessoensis]
MAAPGTNLARFREVGKKILAIGRNYKSHAAELNNPIPKNPLVFIKPTSSYIVEGQRIKFPPGCSELHHEVELGVVIGKGGSNISESDAMEHVGGYVVALDMTARDLQDFAKKNGHPWSLAKSWDTSCPVSNFIEKDKIPNPANLDLWLKVNGELKQKGNTTDMIFPIPFLISFLSSYFTLEEGDLLLTGTPSGVGPVKEGDEIQAGLSDIASITFSVAEDK